MPVGLGIGSFTVLDLLNIPAGSGGGGGGGPYPYGTVQPAFLASNGLRANDEGAPAGGARGSNSVDLQTLRTVGTQIAGTLGAVITGGQNNTASANFSVVAGGDTNTASGINSVVSGGRNNRALSNQSGVLSGYNNEVTSGTYSLIAGGQSNQILSSANNSSVGGGQSNTTSSTFTTISGGQNNSINTGCTLSTISGGGTNVISANAYRSTIAGGYNNTANGQAATVGGGGGNQSNGNYTTVAGGTGNTAGSTNAVVSGGSNNTASASNSVVCGGSSNTASASRAIVIGGFANTASGNYSIAAGHLCNAAEDYGIAIGRRARVLATHTGATVFSDSTNADFNSIAPDEFAIRATGLRLVDGNQALGRVLTCDANGTGTWQPAGGGGSGGTIQPSGANTYNIRATNEGLVAGNARGEASVDLQVVRTNATDVASGNYSVVGGGYSNRASGILSTVSGGRLNSATNFYSVVSGGNNNSATNTNVTISGGNTNTGSGGASTICGGVVQTASGDGSVCLGGSNNTAAGFGSVVSGLYAVANGFAQRTHASGFFASSGDAQTSQFVLRNQTTNGTPTELFLDGAALTMVLQQDTTWGFEALVTARRTDADDESAAYRFFGCIDRNVGVATTALVGSVQKDVTEDVAAWDADIFADTVNGSLGIRVTGEAAKNINWVAFVRVVETTG